MKVAFLTDTLLKAESGNITAFAECSLIKKMFYKGIQISFLITSNIIKIK
jgi:hypothetical protein